MSKGSNTQVLLSSTFFRSSVFCSQPHFRNRVLTVALKHFTRVLFYLVAIDGRNSYYRFVFFKLLK